jgi:hypothetical protein
MDDMSYDPSSSLLGDLDDSYQSSVSVDNLGSGQAALSTVSPNLSVSAQYNPSGVSDASDLSDSLNTAMNFGGTIAAAIVGGNSSGSPTYVVGPAVKTTPSLFSGSGLIILAVVGVGLYFLLRK